MKRKNRKGGSGSPPSIESAPCDVKPPNSMDGIPHRHASPDNLESGPTVYANIRALDEMPRDAQKGDSVFRVEAATSTRWSDKLTIATLALFCATVFLVWQTHWDAKEALDAEMKVNQKVIDAQNTIATLDQRPWISANKMVINGDPDVVGGKIIVVVAADIENTGKTVATDLTFKSRTFYSNRDPDLETFSKLLPSGQTAMSVANGVHRIIDFTTLFAPEEGACYKARQCRLYFQFVLSYSDVFNKQHHTQICVSHGYEELTEMVRYCPGNSMD